MEVSHEPMKTKKATGTRIVLWDVAVISLILSGLIVVTSRTIADPDLWGHLKFGLDTIQNQGVMREDPYSYLTAGQPWINHEWLSEVAFAAAWNAAGTTGLVILKTALWVLAYLLLFRYLAKSIKSHLRVGIVLFISMTLTFPFFITVRPQSFTAVLFILVILAIIKAEGGKYSSLWICPLIFAAWPNLHGAFLAGLGILILWAMMHLISQRKVEIWLKVLLPVMVSVLALLANPYGIDLLTFLLQHLFDPRLEIIEWQPLQIHSLTGAFYLLWIAIILAGFTFSRRPRQPRLLVLLILTAYLPFMALRYTLFFILMAVLIAGEHIGDAWERIMPTTQTKSRQANWVPILALLVSILLLAWKWSNFKEIPIKNPENYPIAAVSILNQSGVNGNLAVHFDWGDYAIWHLAPYMKVSIDTRREMAYSEQIYKENVRYMTGIGDWAALIEDHPTQIALVRSRTPTDNLMQMNSDWIEVYRDEVSVIYSNKNYSQSDQLSLAVQEYNAPEEVSIFP